MLRTMADRDDARPAVLVYANGDWEGAAFRDELERLEGRLNLTVVHVLERPPETWAGETGYVTAEVLSRHLPRGYRRFQFLHLRAGSDDGRGGDRAGRAGRARRAGAHRAVRHGLNGTPDMRHVQMTRLVWLIAALVVVACLVFAAAQG